MISEEVNILNSRLQYIEKLIAQEEERLKKCRNLEKGNLRVCSSHGTVQYHFKKEGSEKEQYLHKYEKEKIKLLVQRDYDLKTLKALKQQQTKIARFLSTYDSELVQDIYNNLKPGRKEFVEPAYLTNEIIINKFYEKYPGNQNTFEYQGKFQTIKGDMVRSKSEKILSDYFYNSNIHYSYEPKFILKNGKAVYPDFVLLNIRKNKAIYWEHLGLIEKDDYASKNFQKLLDYGDNGLIIGENLILTMESSELPLNINQIEKLVKTFIY